MFTHSLGTTCVVKLGKEVHLNQEMLKWIISIGGNQACSQGESMHWAQLQTIQCLLLTTPNLVLGCHTFVPEDMGVSGQQGLEKHWHITLRFIIPQVVLQLSRKKTTEQSSVKLQARTTALLPSSLSYHFQCSVDWPFMILTNTSMGWPISLS